MAEELKPCPFCGGEAVVSKPPIGDSWGGGCGNSACPIWPEATSDYSSKRSVIAAWNTRSPTWQPIETAPRDGTSILAWGPYNQSVCVAMWGRVRRGGEGWQASYEGSRVVESQGDFGTDYIECDPLTHWMPLPAAPKEAGE